MHRLAPVLLIGGALLFANGVYAPAAPVVPRTPATPPSLLVAQAVPIMAEVNAEVDRLRERQRRAPDQPDAERDPFRFGRASREAPPASAEGEPAAEAPAPMLVVRLPRLVAIVATETSDGLVRTAVMTEGVGVRILHEGDAIGAFVVQAIDAGSVALRDPVAGTVHRLALR